MKHENFNKIDHNDNDYKGDTNNNNENFCDHNEINDITTIAATRITTPLSHEPQSLSRLRNITEIMFSFASW